MAISILFDGNPAQNTGTLAAKRKGRKASLWLAYQPVVMHRLYKIFLVSQNLFQGFLLT